MDLDNFWQRWKYTGSPKDGKRRVLKLKVSTNLRWSSTLESHFPRDVKVSVHLASKLTRRTSDNILASYTLAHFCFSYSVRSHRVSPSAPRVFFFKDVLTFSRSFVLAHHIPSRFCFDLKFGVPQNLSL